MGFNPHRKYRASPTDYALVVSALVISIALLVWALAG